MRNIGQILTRISKRKLFAVMIAALLIVGTAGTAITIYFQNKSELPSLIPPVKAHADIPFRPLTTYEQIHAQTLPKDSLQLPAHCQPQTGDWVAAENANPGIALSPTDWKNFRFYNPSGSVLWLDHQSVTCGDRIGIHASLFPVNRGRKIDKSPRSFQVLRIGWYNGAGARMMWNSGPIKLKRRNTPNLKNITRTIETRWPVSTTFDVGADWTPGLYLVASVGPTGNYENIAPFILRSTSSDSKLLLVHSSLTWAAYNSFGGHSTYSAPIRGADERSKVSSLDRPYAGSAESHIERDALSFVQYLESTGLNIDQVTDIDLSNSPSIVSHYGGLIFSGHPEYMTRTEFNTIAAARNMGINIAFMGANSAYWQSRIEPSPIGPDRHLVIYRSALIDPETDWQKVTVEFENPRINTPPSLLTSETTAGVHVTGTMHSVEIPKWLKVPKNSDLSGWSPNSEIDSIKSGPASPPEVHLIYSGKFQLTSPNPSPIAAKRSLTAQTIWFADPSGAATFVSGINYWPCEVSYTCAESTVDDSTKMLLQSITAQVLTLWQEKAVGRNLS
jgi:hypothetical protein